MGGGEDGRMREGVMRGGGVGLDNEPIPPGRLI